MKKKNSEGRNDYDRINIQTNGRLSDTTSSITKKTKKITQGRFSRMRENFLKEYKRGLYEELMIDGKMEEHLGEIEQTAQKRMKQIITSLAEKEPNNREK